MHQALTTDISMSELIIARRSGCSLCLCLSLSDAESTAVLVLRTMRVANVALAQEAWTWLAKAQECV